MTLIDFLSQGKIAWSGKVINFNCKTGPGLGQKASWVRIRSILSSKMAWLAQTLGPVAPSPQTKPSDLVANGPLV